MKLFHKRTRTENIHLIWQSFIVFVIMFAFMFAVRYYTSADSTLGAIGATSLGASAFLSFVAHDTAMAQARRMLSAYFIGLIVGISCSLILNLLAHCNGLHCDHGNRAVFLASVAAFITMIIMLLFSSEHPPAVGIAIGLVLRQWDLSIIVIITLTVLTIALVKGLLRPWLRNLL